MRNRWTGSNGHIYEVMESGGIWEMLPVVWKPSRANTKPPLALTNPEPPLDLTFDFPNTSVLN